MVITLLVLWTWGLTPLWVNIVATCVCGINLIMKWIGYSMGRKLGAAIGELIKEYADDEE